MAYLEPWVTIAPEVPDEVAVLLRDAQTSGGLLLASASPDALVAELTRRGTLAAVIGQVTEGAAGHVTVGP
jgi:selenide,water dikinase